MSGAYGGEGDKAPRTVKAAMPDSVCRNHRLADAAMADDDYDDLLLRRWKATSP